MGHSSSMHAFTSTFRPVGLGVAVTGTALSSLALIGMGMASIAARWAVFGWGIGIVLIVYGLLVGAGAWLGVRRWPFARGLMVAPALLHLATAVSLATSDDLPQRIGALVSAVVFAAIVVGAILPSTRKALSPDEPPPAKAAR